MAKYVNKSDILKAEQFLYTGDPKGIDAVRAAQKLGLSRNGSSALWEIYTHTGWKIVEHGSWILSNTMGEKFIYTDREFRNAFIQFPGL